jgi:FlaA1/EpsC-like NDP-sugar epimerase
MIDQFIFQKVLKNKWFRQSIKMLLDGQIGLLAWLLVFNIYPDITMSTKDVLIWFVIVIICSMAFGITKIHYRMVDTTDLINVLLAGITTFLLSGTAHLLSDRGVAKEIYLILLMVSMLTATAWMMVRISVKIFYTRKRLLPFTNFTRRNTDDMKNQMQTLIAGAGRAGAMTAEELIRHPELGSYVVGFIDDAFEKQGLNIQGIPVMGPARLLPTIIAEKKIERVIIAMPSAPGHVIRALSKSIRAAGAEVKTVPGIYNLLGNQSWKPKIKDISIEDLLKRDPIKLDQVALEKRIKKSVVLITGGGGSIGGELARQVAVYHPEKLILLGRGEYSLWSIERELRNRFPKLQLGIELCDIRNMPRLRQVFHRWNPKIVFHAAAHKHVPFLELHPEEAIENNVFGTKNVLDAAIGVGTEIFVNISTDKSVNPTSVLGVSKCLAERLVHCSAARLNFDGQYVSVRFGNVLGSRGSVIPIFMDQILRGGPVTITDPAMTRYFMTIPEASQLVLQAGVLGKTNGVYVLDMGEPVQILDLARDLITLSGPEIEQKVDIKYTGIRPGEKLHEELFNKYERQSAQIHPKIFEAVVEKTEPSIMEGCIARLRQALAIEEELGRKKEILRQFMSLVPTYSPSPDGLGVYTKHLIPTKIDSSVDGAQNTSKAEIRGRELLGIQAA